MSYNISHTEYLSGKLRINRRDAARLEQDHKDEMPESSFIYDCAYIDDDVVDIEHPDWSGCGSGYTHELLLAALALTTGEADILFVWEGGDSQTVLRVKDGKVRKGKLKLIAEDA